MRRTWSPDATCSYGLQLFNDLVWGRKSAAPVIFPGLTSAFELVRPNLLSLIRGPLSIKLNGTVITENLVVPAGKG